MKNFAMKLWVKTMMPMKNEKGAQSLEWLGLAALLILVLGIVSTALSSQEGAIKTLISDIIRKISNMVGGSS
jgi:hypothetical protein